MPDQVVLGKMRATRELFLTSDPNDPDREKVRGLARADCRPRPGSTTEYVRPDMLSPLVVERFVQAEERARLRELGAAVNPGDTTIAVFSRIIGGLGIQPLSVFYGDAFADLARFVPCHTVEVFLRIRFDLYNIRVVATEDLTVGGTAFPMDDELASFRVAEPVNYRFETQTTFNPLCCEERPPQPAERESPWFPPDELRLGPWLGKDRYFFDDPPRLRMKTWFDR